MNQFLMLTYKQKKVTFWYVTLFHKIITILLCVRYVLSTRWVDAYNPADTAINISKISVTPNA